MTSLFERLGGEAGLIRLIDALYERILADEYLGEYFMGVTIERLKAAQLGFLRQAFGDGTPYRGVPLREAHKDQLVTEHAFDQFIDLFVALAAEAGVDDTTQADAGAALRAQRANVITEFQPNPAYDYQSKPF
jgi:hemoglobin